MHCSCVNMNIIRGSGYSISTKLDRDPNFGGHIAAFQRKIIEIGLNFIVIFTWVRLLKSNSSYENTKNEVFEDVIIE